MLNPKNILPGNEQYETFDTHKGKRVQYDYRHTDGKLFSTIALSLEDAHHRRDKWIAELERPYKGTGVF